MEEPKPKRRRTTAGPNASSANSTDAPQDAQSTDKNARFAHIVEQLGPTVELKALLVKAAVRDPNIAQGLIALSSRPEKQATQQSKKRKAKAVAEDASDVVWVSEEEEQDEDDEYVEADATDDDLCDSHTASASGSARISRQAPKNNAMVSGKKAASSNKPVAAGKAGNAKAARAKRTSALKKPKKLKDKDFENLLVKAEVAMGYTGKLDKLSDARQRSVGMDNEFKLESYANKMIAAMQEEGATWVTKRNAMTGILDLFWVIFGAPPGKSASHNRNNHFWLARAFEKAANTLSHDERVRLATEGNEYYMGRLDDLWNEAESYCVAESTYVGKVRDILRAAVSPGAIVIEDDDDADGIDE